MSARTKAYHAAKRLYPATHRPVQPKGKVWHKLQMGNREAARRRQQAYRAWSKLVYAAAWPEEKL